MISDDKLPPDDIINILLNYYNTAPSFFFMTLGDLTHSFNEICTEFLEAKFVYDLFSSFFQLFFVTGKDLPHFRSPFFFGFAQKTAALTNRLSRSSAVISNNGYS